jgi:hypothetical protein
MHSLSSTFRFNALPREIRDKIYRELLCDFKPHPTTVVPEYVLEYEPAKNHIDTGIMRPNKAIYAEAYDTMIKTNRFVKITSTQGLPLRLLVDGVRMRVVAWNKKVAESFKGYVIAVHLSSSRSLPIPQHRTGRDTVEPCTLMVLHWDMDVFCDGLSDGDKISPGFSDILQISLSAAPILYEEQSSKYSPSMGNQPFRFMDLPAELRNQVYALLLYFLGERETTRGNQIVLPDQRAQDTISRPRFCVPTARSTERHMT